MTTLHISNNLTYMRKQLQWTQDGLAEQLGVSFQAVSKWENSLAYPDITLLPEIAKLFQITIDELLLVDLSIQPKKAEESDLVHAQEEHIQESAAVNGENQYSIKLFYNGSEASTFPDWAKNIEVQLSGGVNNVDSAFSIQCDAIAGNATAGVNINCDNIEGNAHAGGVLNCDDINGAASAGGNINCDTIRGDAKAGSSISCDTIHGQATAGYQINCEQILNEN